MWQTCMVVVRLVLWGSLPTQGSVWLIRKVLTPCRVSHAKAVPQTSHNKSASHTRITTTCSRVATCRCQLISGLICVAHQGHW